MTSLVRRNRNPWSLINRDEFLTPFDSLFESLTQDLWPELHKDLGTDFFGKGSYPKVAVRDDEKEIVIEAEVPGLKKDQVKVEIEEGVLRLKGEKREENREGGKNYIHNELKRSSFCRSFVLNDNVDVDKVSAEFEDGILVITLPKLKPTSSPPSVKQVDIK